MADISFTDIKQILREEFVDTLVASRDEGLDQMADVIARHASHDRASAEAALAEMVEQGTLRYVTDESEGPGAGIIGTLTDPNPANVGTMTSGKPLQGAVPAGQEHGSGYWDLTAD